MTASLSRTSAVTGVVVSALAVVAGAVATPAAAQPVQYALPACYAPGTPPSERPSQVVFQTCADGSKELTNLIWTQWGSGGAEGTGTFSYQVCEPNCAAGHRESFRAVIRADEALTAPPASRCPAGTEFYANLIVAFPERVPAADGSPDFTIIDPAQVLRRVIA